MNKFFTIVALLFIAVTTMMIWATQGEKENSLAASAGISGEEQSPATTQEAAIGGTFSLTDQENKQRSSVDFKGKLMLVFFGFTHCPDICPVTVSTFSSLMELLGDKADQLAPIFITVDPARDTPAVMKDFLSNFDKRIVGLTGSKDDIKAVADAYKAYYSETKKPAEENKVDHAAMGHAPPAVEDNYFVDHSGYIYLMDRDGKYVQHFSYNVSEQELADTLKPLLQ